MNMKEKIMIIGGDKRNYYLTKELFHKGYNAVWYACENFGSNREEFVSSSLCLKDIENFHVLVLPLPLTKDSVHISTPYSDQKIKISEICQRGKGKLIFSSEFAVGNSVNYFSAKDVVVANARLTALGLLKEMLIHTETDIMNKSVMVTGFGNVGKAVAKILNDNGMRVTVCARNKEQRATAESCGLMAYSIDEGRENISSFDFVVNTVPFELFSSETVKKAKENCVFFELAKGLPKETCSSHCAYIMCKGMPGKHVSESAGKVIADFICEQLEA